MVGTRVTPDNNDIVVWKLDEATVPFVNSSTSTSAPSHAVSDLTTISGNVKVQQPSPFSAFGPNSCVQFSGDNNGSPRNFISGANSFTPQPPITVSMWYYQRQYDTTSFTQHGLTKQTQTGVWSGSSFGSVDLAQNRRYAGQANQYDFFFATGTFGNAGGDVVSVPDFTIPLNIWSHIGMTYDGTTVTAYINGNSIGTATASPTGNIFYSGSPGPWFVGAIPSGSGNPEEGQYGVCDIRIANVVRPQSYFQNIYQQAMFNSGQALIITTYYKMRAFDTALTNVPVYWVDTTISYAKAPASPSGGSLGPIEVLETWKAVG